MSDLQEIIRKGKVQASKTIEEQASRLRYLKASVALAKKMGQPVTQQEAALRALEDVLENLRKATAAFGVE